MKVLVVTSTFQKTETDPVTDFIFNWLKEFRRQGHEVKVVAAHCPGVAPRDTIHGVPVERFRYFYPPKYERLAYRYGIADNLRESHLAKLQFIPYMLSGTLKVMKVVNEFRPDIVHALWAFPNGYMAALAKKLSKFPLVVSVIGTEAYLAKKAGLSHIISFPCNTADYVVSVSSTSIAAAKECGVKKDIEMIFNGVDIHTFNPNNDGTNVRKELGFSPKDKMVLCIGRMVERKGQSYVIEAMKDVVKKHPETKLVLLGHGPMEKELKALAEKGPGEENIIFAGKRPHSELKNFYAAADIFIIPSIVDSSGVAEGGQGLVTKEAMVSKVPVIGTNIGGIPDIVKDNETGLLVPEKDSKAIAGAISKLVADSSLRKRLAEQGYKIAMRKASWEGIVDRYEVIYKGIIDGEEGKK